MREAFNRQIFRTRTGTSLYAVHPQKRKSESKGNRRTAQGAANNPSLSPVSAVAIVLPFRSVPSSQDFHRVSRYEIKAY